MSLACKRIKKLMQLLWACWDDTNAAIRYTDACNA